MRVGSVFILIASLLTAGCAGPGGDLPDALDPTLASAFAPVAMRISPLTRLETGTDGKPELAVYFELTDNWGHSTKAPGVAQVQVYRLGGVSAGLATLADRWEADLTNPARNSALFDVTRMYRLPLAQLPEWLAERADGQGQRERVRIRLFYRTIGEGGVTVDLRDTFEKDF
ncbi:MAG: hypothetical protein ACIARQ_13110 [Phycisphaerales bacterium JB061]